MRDRFRLVANAVDVVTSDEPLPNLPVARALWQPKPDFATSAAAWLTAGAAHHTVLTTAVGMDVFEDFAEIAQDRTADHRRGHHHQAVQEGTELERRLLQAGRRAVTEYGAPVRGYTARHHCPGGGAARAAVPGPGPRCPVPGRRAHPGLPRFIAAPGPTGSPTARYKLRRHGPPSTPSRPRPSRPAVCPARLRPELRGSDVWRSGRSPPRRSPSPRANTGLPLSRLVASPPPLQPFDAPRPHLCAPRAMDGGTRGGDRAAPYGPRPLSF